MANAPKEEEIDAHVVVNVSLRVYRGGYNGTHRFDEVYRQAEREAIEEVERALQKHPTMRVESNAVVSVTLSRKGAR